MEVDEQKVVYNYESLTEMAKIFRGTSKAQFNCAYLAKDFIIALQNNTSIDELKKSKTSPSLNTNFISTNLLK